MQDLRDSRIDNYYYKLHEYSLSYTGYDSCILFSSNTEHRIKFDHCLFSNCTFTSVCLFTFNKCSFYNCTFEESTCGVKFNSCIFMETKFSSALLAEVIFNRCISKSNTIFKDADLFSCKVNFIAYEGKFSITFEDVKKFSTKIIYTQPEVNTFIDI